MTDIVERLEQVLHGIRGVDPGNLASVVIIRDAMDEFEQLRADNARLREALGEIENNKEPVASWAVEKMTAIARRALSDAPTSEASDE